MRRSVLGVLVLVSAMAGSGCLEVHNDWDPRPGFGAWPAEFGEEMWHFCRSGSTIDACCSGYGEQPCPEGWAPVPIASLPETCCMDASGNAFWTAAGRCDPAWTTVEDGCLGHQPLCD